MKAGPELDGRIAKAAEALRKEGAAEVYVFGSAARGTTTDMSDLDMAVSGLPPRRFFFAIGRAADAADMVVDLVDLDIDSPFIRVLKQHEGLRRVG